MIEAVEALREAEFGNMEAVRQQAHVALNRAAGRDVRAWTALAFARVGDVAEARKLAQLSADFPSATLVQNYWLPAIRAAMEVQANHAARAIDLLHTAESYELSYDAPLIPVYIRAEAYLAAKQGRAAEAEFQKILHHRGIARNSPVAALARLGLARAYAISADPIKSRQTYQEFLTLWKDADPDIPLLQQAKAAFVHLN